jgi:hypothetical protein
MKIERGKKIKMVRGREKVKWKGTAEHKLVAGDQYRPGSRLRQSISLRTATARCGGGPPLLDWRAGGGDLHI